MHRLLGGSLVLLVGMVGAVVYSGVITEHRFQQLIADGDRALGQRDVFRAIEAYSGALTLRPASMAVHLKRGETYRRQGDLQAATRDLVTAATIDPSATRPHERLGDVALSRGAYDEAVEHYTRYVRMDDQDPRGLYKLALVSYYGGRVAQVETHLRRALALDDHLIEAHYLLGLGLGEQDRLDEAAEHLERAVELSPSLLAPREALAETHRRRGDGRAERQQLDALAVLDPRPGRQVTRALAYARAGQVDLAVLALGVAVDDHPDQPLVYEALGWVWFEIAQARDDQVALQKAIEALSSIPTAAASSRALTLLGRARVRQGDIAGARRLLRRATTRFPVEPSAFSQLAALEEASNNWEAARTLRRQYDALTSPTVPSDPRVAPPPTE